jgi:hypothetical protein
MLLTISGYTQNKISGKYNYYAYTLDLYDDSTFHITYKFDLVIDIGHGKYIINNDTLIMKYVKLFDTIYYYDSIKEIYKSNERDSIIQINNPKRKLLLIQNDKSDIQSKNIDYEEICCSIGCGLRDFPKKLYYKSSNLFFIDSNGKLIKRSKGRTLNGQKIKPVYFNRIE